MKDFLKKKIKDLKLQLIRILVCNSINENFESDKFESFMFK